MRFYYMLYGMETDVSSWFSMDLILWILSISFLDVICGAYCDHQNGGLKYITLIRRRNVNKWWFKIELNTLAITGIYSALIFAIALLDFLRNDQLSHTAISQLLTALILFFINSFLLVSLQNLVILYSESVALALPALLAVQIISLFLSCRTKLTYKYYIGNLSMIHRSSLFEQNGFSVWTAVSVEFVAVLLIICFGGFLLRRRMIRQKQIKGCFRFWTA